MVVEDDVIEEVGLENGVEKVEGSGVVVEVVGSGVVVEVVGSGVVVEVEGSGVVVEVDDNGVVVEVVGSRVVVEVEVVVVVVVVEDDAVEVVVSKGGGVLQMPQERRQISSMLPVPHLPLAAFFRQKLVFFSLKHSSTSTSSVLSLNKKKCRFYPISGFINPTAIKNSAERQKKISIPLRKAGKMNTFILLRTPSHPH